MNKRAATGNQIQITPKRGIFYDDFNTKLPIQRSNKEDDRDRIVREFITIEDLLGQKIGNSPAYKKGNTGLHIDLTITTRGTGKSIKQQRVLSGQKTLVIINI